jgi:hypothetical protein
VSKRKGRLLPAGLVERIVVTAARRHSTLKSQNETGRTMWDPASAGLEDIRLKADATGHFFTGPSGLQDARM